MKNLKLIIIAAILLGLIGVAYIWFFVYNKEHTDYTKIEAAYTLPAEQCFQSFVTQNEDSKAMLGQVIQITGTAQKLEIGDSLNTLVFVFNEGMFGDEGIRCVLSKEGSNIAESFKLPTQLTIKGYAVGFNETDLVMEQCIIEN